MIKKIKKNKNTNQTFVQNNLCTNCQQMYNTIKPILEIKNVSMKYKKNNYYSVKNVSFNVWEGQFHAFIGENGSGKSTIINMIIGMNKKFEGDVLINGYNIKNEIIAKEQLCFIPDKAIFPKKMNVKEFLLQFALLSKRQKFEATIEIEEIAKQLDIFDVLNKNPNNLSSGQKRKVLLIKAVVERSKLIVLDEPAANMDPTSRYQLFQYLKSLNEQGITIILCSHLLNEIKDYINSATFISKGQLIWTGPIASDDFINVYDQLIINRNWGSYE